MSTCSQSALTYSVFGWHVLPIHYVRKGRCGCGNPDCGSPGKHPLTRRGLKDASRNAGTIRTWWKRWPDANVGIRTGSESSLVVIDIDPRHQGDESLEKLIAEHGDLPETIEVLTGGGGRHFFFQYPDVAIGNRANILPGIDSRGDNGYVVAPPSGHVSGGRYRFAPGRNLKQADLAELPPWLLELLIRDPAPVDRGATEPDASGKLLAAVTSYIAKADAVAEGGRNSAAFSLAGHIAAFQTPDGGRLDAGQVSALMGLWNSRNRPPLGDRELDQVIQSALSNGRPRAAHVVEPDRKKIRETTTKRPAPIVLPWRPFPTTTLPEQVAGFIRAGARSLVCDEVFIAAPLIAGLTSAIGAARRIRLSRTWTEPAVIWAVIVSESGTMKSPAQGLALGFLRRLQKWRLQEYPEMLESYRRDMRLYEADLGEWKRTGRKKGEPLPEEPPEPTVARYTVSDVTIEGLADRLQHAPRGLLVDADELASWLQSFDQYRGGKGGDVARWLSIHRAETLTIDRKTGAKTIFIPHAAVSLCGGVQPKTLARHLGQEHTENGLLARLLVVAPPRRAKKWSDARVDPDVMRSMEKLFARLLALELGDDDNGHPAPIDAPLTQSGKEVWRRFVNEHGLEQVELEGSLAAAWSKLEAYAARLALLIHFIRLATDDPSLEHPDQIDAHSVTAGVSLARWFGGEARRVYGLLSESDEDREVRRLIEMIQRRGGSITANDLRRRSRQYATSDDAERALGGLVKAGIGRWEPVSGGESGGRPTRVFQLVSPVSVSETPLEPEENQGLGYGYTVESPENTDPPDDDWEEI